MGLASLIQQAIKFTSVNTTEAGRQQAERKLPESVHVCFSISVYAFTTGPDGNAEPIEVHELEAGKSYEVIIQCEQSHNRPDVVDHLITGNFALAAQGTYKPLVPHQPLYHTFDIAYDNICRPRYELPAWHVTIPEDLPTCDLTFSLTLRESSFHPRSNIAPRTFHVRSQKIPEDTQMLAACNIATGLPGNAAVLTLASENAAAPSDTLVLRCRNHFIGEINLKLDKRLIVGTAQLFPQKPVSHILNTIHAFSRDHAGRLVRWLNKLAHSCHHYQKLPFIIIVDTTGGGLEIAWELLEIDTNLYLGELTQIVRWYPFSPFGKARMLELKEVVYEGSVLAYVHHGLAGIDHERAILDKFAKKEIANFAELRRHLKRSGELAEIGLVYIASHGHGSNTLMDEASDQAIQQPNKQLRALELERMPEHKEPRPIFFVNACDSARMLRNKGDAPNSFAESFMVQCASNYIGTVAPVNSIRASLIAKAVLEQAQEAEGVQIAEMLRRLRAQAAEKLRDADLAGDDQKERYEKELFFTSMYVYYGNPLARLRLCLASSEEAGE
ncbi:MAG TPA: CHAT domain-containing protein [Ktedonosporobacter sp.]|jgi:hypothetical protein|nr:CHAT domain-containing protein [Ktedonosporobacter sp.]